MRHGQLCVHPMRGGQVHRIKLAKHREVKQQFHSHSSNQQCTLWHARRIRSVSPPRTFVSELIVPSDVVKCSKGCSNALGCMQTYTEALCGFDSAFMIPQLTTCWLITFLLGKDMVKLSLVTSMRLTNQSVPK